MPQNGQFCACLWTAIRPGEVAGRFDEGIAYLSGDVVISILHNRLVEKHLVHIEPCGLQLMTWA